MTQVNLFNDVVTETDATMIAKTSFILTVLLASWNKPSKLLVKINIFNYDGVNLRFSTLYNFVLLLKRKNTKHYALSERYGIKGWY